MAQSGEAPTEKDEPATTGPRAGSGRHQVQIRWLPPSADGQYVAEQAWRWAVLDACPFHGDGGCGLARHGSYRRAHPEGARVARFRCPVRGVTISLLPTFLAARLSSTLDEVEHVIDAVETSASLAEAVERVRPADEHEAVTSISAARWVRRRLRPIRAALLALVTLMPELAQCAATLAAVRARLGASRVLVTLSERGAPYLRALAPPLGLSSRGGR